MLLIQLFSLLLSGIFATMVNVRDDKSLGDTFTLDKTSIKLSKKGDKLQAAIKLESNAAVIGISADYAGKKLTFKAYDKDADDIEWNHDFVAIAVSGILGRTIMLSGLSPLQKEAQKHFEKNAKPNFMKRVMKKLDEHSALKTAVKKFEIAEVKKEEGGENKENKENK